MTLQQEKLDDRPPNPLLDALDILQLYERGELHPTSPDDLLYLQAAQVLKIGLSRAAITGATV